LTRWWPGKREGLVATLRFREAIRQALIEEMERDERVVILGQDLTSGMHGTSAGLEERFGSRRVRDLPVSELANAGVAVGAALTGLRPVLDFTNASFMYLALDQIINAAAKLHFLSGGQYSVPVVFRATLSYMGGNAAQHSDRPFAQVMSVPGLSVIAPSDPVEAKGLMKAAIRSDNPVVCFEDSNLGALRAEVPDDPDFLMPIGVNTVKRKGRDVTIAAVAGSVRASLIAAENLSRQDLSVEVVSMSSLSPLDLTPVLESVDKTRRLIVVDPSNPLCSPASEIAAAVAELLHHRLVAGPRRLTARAVHPPYAPELERNVYPTAGHIEAAVHDLVEAVSR
jgi:pyruvate/2-oxoglutarate/acetoin dehydrogenase E1 component